MDYLVGLLIGILCGAVPIIFGWFTKHKILGIVGCAVTIISGPLFVLLNKSPFTAIGIAAIFTIFNFATHRNKTKEHHDSDEDDQE